MIAEGVLEPSGEVPVQSARGEAAGRAEEGAVPLTGGEAAVPFEADQAGIFRCGLFPGKKEKKNPRKTTGRS